MEVLAADADVRIVIDRREKLGLDGPGAAALNATIQLDVESPSPQTQVRRLIAHADRACHAARSLAVAVPVELQVMHNGELVPDEVIG